MAEKRYKTEDLFESIEDTKNSWEKNESLGEKKDLKLQAELVCVLIRCCAQYIRDNTPVITTVRFFFNDDKK